MTFKGVAVLGLITLACAGCASGTRPLASNPQVRSDVVVGASPMTVEPMTVDVQQCEGWYDVTARACDSIGD